jgi:NADH:ubiquinone reductase (H+-translocating)
MTDPAPSEGPAVVLGAGYAGVSVAHHLERKGRHKIPVVVVDRHPSHVLRTGLYAIDKLASSPDPRREWAIPIERVLDGKGIEYRPGEVASIDLDQRTVTMDTGVLSYRSLAICLGSVVAYYGVSGADQYTYSPYRLGGALDLAIAVRELESRSKDLPAGLRPRIAVIGGGATGTEIAAEIASARWDKIVGHEVRPPQVQLIAGANPFLEGLHPALARHARKELARAGVALDEGRNVTKVERDRLTLADGTVVPFEIAVWCAGVQVPPLVRNLPVPHGRAGRIKVAPTLEVPDRPGVFGVGDVVDFEDPRTKAPVPATAQAAMAEAPVAAANMAARWNGTTMRSFRYHEKAMIVSLGVGRAAARFRHVSIWGRPAALLKALVDKEYETARRHGQEPPAL